VPTRSPAYSIEIASSGPSPMTIVPSIGTVSNVCRMASIAALSTATSSPRPMSRDEPSADASVTRTRSMPRFRSMKGQWRARRSSSVYASGMKIPCSRASRSEKPRFWPRGLLSSRSVQTQNGTGSALWSRVSHEV
jgi:hypothetical protein